MDKVVAQKIRFGRGLASCLRTLSAVVAAAFAVGVATAAEKPAGFPTDPSKVFLVLMIGQSNMAGRGVVTTENDTLNNRVFSLRKQYNYSTRRDDNYKWEVAKDPIHWDKAGAGVGPGRSFAEEYLKDHPDMYVCLVPVACGGTDIAEFMPGMQSRGTYSYPWDDAVVRIAAASTDGTWGAILFHQGENDAASAEKANAYEPRLFDLLARTRAEIKGPDVPIIIGQIGTWSNQGYTSYPELIPVVTAAHQNATNAFTRCAFVPSTGLTYNNDIVHFDADSQKEFGRRYYNAYKEIVK